jgi:hypothetical protein
VADPGIRLASPLPDRRDVMGALTAPSPSARCHAPGTDVAT